MVSTFLLVRLLQEANSQLQNKPHQECLKVDDNSRSENQIATLEKNIFYHKCRVCLQRGKLPLYNKNTASYLVQYLEIFGGIKISKNDKYPKYLCEPCFNTLGEAIKFRKTAKKSQQLLEKTEQSSNDQDMMKILKETKIKKSFPTENTLKKPADPLHIKDVKDKNVYKGMMSLANDESFLIRQSWKEQRSEAEYLRSRRKNSKSMCEVCGKTFKQACVLKRHSAIHSNEFAFKCDLCPYRGRALDLLVLHKRVHSRDYKYTCSKCPKKFIFISNLHKHLRRHEKPMFQCDACNKSFYEKYNLKQHFKRRHLGIHENSTCTTCGKVYSTRKQMLVHAFKAHKRKKATSRAHYHEAEFLASTPHTD